MILWAPPGVFNNFCCCRKLKKKTLCFGSKFKGICCLFNLAQLKRPACIVNVSYQIRLNYMSHFMMDLLQFNNLMVLISQMAYPFGFTSLFFFFSLNHFQCRCIYKSAPCLLLPVCRLVSQFWLSEWLRVGGETGQRVFPLSIGH